MAPVTHTLSETDQACAGSAIAASTTPDAVEPAVFAATYLSDRETLAKVTHLSDLAPSKVGATHRDLGLMPDIDYFGNDIDLGGVTYPKDVMVVRQNSPSAIASHDLSGASRFEAKTGLRIG